MKIMGLQDGTYYLGWFLLFFVFAFYNSAIATIIYCWRYFSRINFLLVFLTILIYSCSVFGLCWVFVAFIPNTRGITMLSILFQIITMFFAVQMISQYTDPAVLHGLSILPNIPLGQIVKLCFFW